MRNLYINGILCNGSGRGKNEYKSEELLSIARQHGIPVPSGTKKEGICRMLLNAGIASQELPKPAPKKTYASIEQLMREIKVTSPKKLLGFSEREMEDIIMVTKMYDNSMSMKDFLRNYTGPDRVKQFLITLATKYCRCLKEVEKKQTGYTPGAVCTNAVFTKKGLKGPGASFQCEPVPLLLAPKGKRVVLEKQDKAKKEKK
jgi:hypothetical protein